MKEGFIEWTPEPDSLQRLGQIGSVLAQYKQMRIKLTLRQLYYQLVSKNIIPNKQREYKNLGNLLSKARLAGLVDWEIIEDRVRQVEHAGQWSTIQSIVETAVAAFRLPRWADQDQYVELWCEKDALSSVLDPICRDLHVPFMVNRGYSSSSAMYESSKRIEEAADGRDATIIYLGDFDPSGEDMVRDIRDRMRTFGISLDVTKLALTPDQIEEHDLPPNPAKMTDSRAENFVAEHGSDSYEVDALPPEILQALVREAIEERMDLDKYEEVKEEEERLKAKLIKVAAGVK